jgi:LmbE family N-acetylglucosaminyl deacetylase
MNKALIVAAHPDDDILGCGGILSRFRNKVEFKVIFIAEGTSCRFVEPHCDESKSETEIRNSYGKQALEFLGVTDYEFKNLPCGRLDQTPLIEINKIIEKAIREFEPDTVFTHANCDSNQDHVKVYNATLISTRPGCNSVKNVYSYEVLSSSEWGFHKAFTPNAFFALEEKNVREKYDALDMYKSEIRPFPFPRSEKGIFTLAAQRGMQSGNEYAEAFRIVRQVQ